MATNCASSGSALKAGSSAMSLRVGIQFATFARSTVHFFPASNLMNFHAASGLGQLAEIEDAATLVSVGALGMLAGPAATNILPLSAGLSPTTFAMAQYALRIVAIFCCAKRFVC